jgi:nicotinamidase/pyrazinamidase
MKTRQALLLVDVQRDFFPGGALAAPSAEEIIPAVNRLIGHFRRAALPVFATRDWHPENHCSFREEGGPWPRHCVAGTRGAAFHPEIDIPESVTVVSTATDPKKEAYSGFDGTNLSSQLRHLGVSEVIVAGLATEYCVKATVLDALREGLDVIVARDGIRAVEVEPGDGEKAIREMQEAGARFATVDAILPG